MDQHLNQLFNNLSEISDKAIELSENFYSFRIGDLHCEIEELATNLADLYTALIRDKNLKDLLCKHHHDAHTLAGLNE